MVEEMQRQFETIIRKRVDFKIVEVYLEYCSNILNRKDLCEEVVARIKRKVRASSQRYSVEESPQATV